MFKKVTKKMIKRCTDDLEFYDKHGHFPYEKKKILINISYACLEKLEGKNRGLEIEKALGF
jgi:hypothetical protein